MSDRILFLGMSFVIVVLALSHAGRKPEPEAVASPPAKSQAMQHAMLCLEMAFVVCEEDGLVVCGLDLRSCWFECCDGCEVRGE